jgi:hypothetical protein
MSHIPGVPEHKANIFVRFAYWLSKKRIGKVVEPLAVTAHHPWIFAAIVPMSLHWSGRT